MIRTTHSESLAIPVARSPLLCATFSRMKATPSQVSDITQIFVSSFGGYWNHRLYPFTLMCMSPPKQFPPDALILQALGLCPQSAPSLFADYDCD